MSFDNGIQFGSLFGEPIITDILRDHGIKTHRCNYAKLYVNEEYRGVYVNVEPAPATGAHNPSARFWIRWILP